MLWDLVSRWLPAQPEQFVYLGWLVPVLAGGGAVVLWRSGQRALTVVLGTAALLPVLLALGTNFPLYELLWNALPPLRFPRVPGRLMPIADLAVAALAAVAVARVLAASGRRAGLATAAALALVAADLLVFPLRPSAADEGNDAYAALADEPPGPRSRASPLRAGDPLRQRLRLLPAAGTPPAPGRLFHPGAPSGLRLLLPAQPTLVRSLAPGRRGDARSTSTSAR